MACILVLLLERIPPLTEVNNANGTQVQLIIFHSFVRSFIYSLDLLYLFLCIKCIAIDIQ